MIPDAEEQINQAIMSIKQDGQSRGHSLAITKLEEAHFWLLKGRHEAYEKSRSTGDLPTRR